MATTTRTYGRKGFTTRKAITTVLAPFEGRARRTRTDIDGLDIDGAKRLLAALPAEQLDDRHTDGAPTLAEMVAFGAEVGAAFVGFRVHDDQPDERITLTGLRIPQTTVDAATMRRVVDRAADAKLSWTRKQGQVLLDVVW